ncbi:MAG TPA: MtrB/PioB family outer membrane beta-barrel protein, partial [Steroidobacteraceae bacterium]|nr:MtrB/PioB family outer membrane beta-barrel protein [Steroidobacteraceae bacterium]
EQLSGAISVSRSRRDGSNWLRDNSGTGVTEVPDASDPSTGFARGIFMPTLADRQRDKLRLQADWQPSDELSLQREIGRDEETRAALLLERARRDEILAPALKRTSGTAPRKLTGRWGALLAAGIAGLAVALVWTLRPAVEAPIMRGAPDAIHRMVADDPAALRSQIVSALRDAGVEPASYERFGRAGLDADLPRPLTPAVRTVLERFGVPPPGDSVLRIEIAPRPGS